MTKKDSLIEFPTDFMIKVFGPNDEAFIGEIDTIVNEHYQNDKPANLTHQFSKNASYVSISITVYVISKEELDSIYRALTKHPRVKMVL